MREMGLLRQTSERGRERSLLGPVLDGEARHILEVALIICDQNRVQA
jgi:hypothetical protein